MGNISANNFLKSYSSHDIINDLSYKIKVSANNLLVKANNSRKARSNGTKSSYPKIKTKNQKNNNEINQEESNYTSIHKSRRNISQLEDRRLSCNEANKNVDKNLQNKLSKRYTTNNSLVNEKKIIKDTNSNKSKDEKNQDKVYLWEDIRKHYKFGNVIGKGRYGEVRVCCKKKDTFKLFAVKSVFKMEYSKEELELIINEIKILVKLDHPYIININEIYQDEHFIHIVTELCEGGELFDKIKNEGKLRESFVINIVYKLLSSLAYCHSKGIVHRDLKPENILLEEKENKNTDIKIIDFNLAYKHNNEDKKIELNKITGTPFYIAPEVLKGYYNEKCDIWSIGVITYAMLTGKLPFFCNKGNTNNIFNQILTKEPSFTEKDWDGISTNAINFIKKCLNKSPSERMSAVEAMKNEWLSPLNLDYNNKNLHQIYPNIQVLKNIISFKYNQKLIKLVIKSIINSFLTKTQLAVLKKEFNLLSISQSGYITEDELLKAYSKVGLLINKEELSKVFFFINSNNEGKLEYSDFLVGAINPEIYNNEKTLEKIFSKINWSGTGLLTACDLLKYFSLCGVSVSIDECENIINEALVAFNLKQNLSNIGQINQKEASLSTINNINSININLKNLENCFNANNIQENKENLTINKVVSSNIESLLSHSTMNSGDNQSTSIHGIINTSQKNNNASRQKLVSEKDINDLNTSIFSDNNNDGNYLNNSKLNNNSTMQITESISYIPVQPNHITLSQIHYLLN